MFFIVRSFAFSLSSGTTACIDVSFLSFFLSFLSLPSCFFASVNSPNECVGCTIRHSTQPSYKLYSMSDDDTRYQKRTLRQSHTLKTSNLISNESFECHSQQQQQQRISNSRKRLDGLMCSICKDSAHGYNFDVITCESCKAFFRRNALKKPVCIVWQKTSIHSNRIFSFREHLNVELAMANVSLICRQENVAKHVD